jgi:calcineurin-like phosphoesterase family protein
MQQPEEHGHVHSNLMKKRFDIQVDNTALQPVIRELMKIKILLATISGAVVGWMIYHIIF